MGDSLQNTWRRWEMGTKCWPENSKLIDKFGGFGIDKRIIFGKYNVKVRTGFIWLWILSNDGACECLRVA
jgi:hypothetical protein